GAEDGGAAWQATREAGSVPDRRRGSLLFPSRPRRPLPDLLADPQPRGRGAGIERRLAGARSHRPRRQHAQLRLVPAYADRELGRAGAAARPLPERVLDDPVLERVEAD